MLENLPAELFDEIILDFNMRDIYALRLASSRLQKKTRQVFLVSFSRIKVNFSRGSNRRLAGIASCDDIRLAVRSLWTYAPVEKDRAKDVPAYGHDVNWPRSWNGALKLSSCKQADEFTELLVKFPNCTAVVAWNRDEVSRGYAVPESKKGLSASEALELVLRAYSDPRTPPLRRLYTWAARSPHRASYSTSQHAPHGSNSFAADLEELVIQHRTEPEDEDYAGRLADFLPARPRLKGLSFIGLDHPCLYNPHADFPRPLPLSFWASTPPLESLTLGYVALKDGDLRLLLRQLTPRLATLRFYCVLLTHTNTWARILSDLSNADLPRLREVSIYACRSLVFNTAAWPTLAFCPLLDGLGELREACGGTLEVGWGWIWLGKRARHVIGVRFEAGRGGDEGMRMVLKAIAETQRSHDVVTEYRHDCEWEVPCVLEDWGQLPPGLDDVGHAEEWISLQRPSDDDIYHGWRARYVYSY